jgi:hypothetical protein
MWLNPLGGIHLRNYTKDGKPNFGGFKICHEILVK